MRFDKRKPVVLTPEEVERLPEFAPLNAQQKTFVLLLAGGATAVSALQGSYACGNRRSAIAMTYDLMNRKTMQHVLNRLYGQKDDDRAEFVKRIDKLIRRGSKTTDAEVHALVLYGIANDFLPPDYRVGEQAKLAKFNGGSQ